MKNTVVMNTDTNQVRITLLLSALRDKCRERVELMYPQGRRRNDAVLDYFAGAGTALGIAGDTDGVKAVSAFISMVLVSRGYQGLIDG